MLINLQTFVNYIDIIMIYVQIIQKSLNSCKNLSCLKHNDRDPVRCFNCKIVTTQIDQ